MRSALTFPGKEFNFNQALVSLAFNYPSAFHSISSLSLILKCLLLLSHVILRDAGSISKAAISFHSRRQALQPQIRRTRSARTHLARPPQQQTGFNVLFSMWFMGAGLQTPVLSLLLWHRQSKGQSKNPAKSASSDHTHTHIHTAYGCTGKFTFRHILQQDVCAVDSFTNGKHGSWFKHSTKPWHIAARIKTDMHKSKKILFTWQCLFVNPMDEQARNKGHTDMRFTVKIWCSSSEALLIH